MSFPLPFPPAGTPTVE